jgi:hypothetical protein
MLVEDPVVSLYLRGLIPLPVDQLVLRCPSVSLALKNEPGSYMMRVDLVVV